MKRLAFLLCLLAWPAGAQQMPCADRQETLQQLREKFGEGPAGFGMVQNGAVVELLVSPAGSWSILLSMPNGKSCLVATGSDWEAIKPGKDS